MTLSLPLRLPLLFWLGTLGLYTAGSALGQPAKQAGAPRPALQPENVKWLVDGVGSLKDKEVLKKLGPPDRLLRLIDPNIGTERTYFIWEEVSRVVVDFSSRDGKAVTLEGTFSPHLKAKRVTPENFRKLKVGMTEAQVDKLIGGVKDVAVVTVEYVEPGGAKDSRYKRVEWTASRQLKVWFETGDLAGVVGGSDLRE